MDTNILLESGTNELEVLEFTLGDNHYGINVAKIREILQYMPVTPVPNTHPSVEGIFMPRDTMITVINLKNCLNLPQTDEKGLFIITNFNKLNVAFHVDQVIGIHRVSWENIIKPDETLTGEHGSTATGVIKMDDRLIVILDFEAIVASMISMRWRQEIGVMLQFLSQRIRLYCQSSSPSALRSRDIPIS